MLEVIRLRNDPLRQRIRREQSKKCRLLWGLGMITAGVDLAAESKSTALAVIE